MRYNYTQKRSTADTGPEATRQGDWSSKDCGAPQRRPQRPQEGV